jgi:hypothetical protein
MIAVALELDELVGHVPMAERHWHFTIRKGCPRGGSISVGWIARVAASRKRLGPFGPRGDCSSSQGLSTCSRRNLRRLPALAPAATGYKERPPA